MSSAAYMTELAEGDTQLAWRKRLAIVVWALVAVNALAYAGKLGRPLIHIDAETVAGLPVRRLVNVTPDVIDAEAMAQECARRFFRLNPTTVADDQAWFLNHTVPELAERLRDPARQIVEGTRKKKGEVVVTVKSVTPVKGDQPPFLVEVVLSQEFRGDYAAPGMGRPDPSDPRREEYRWTFRLVQTAKTSDNPYALLVRDMSLTTIRS